MKIQGNWLAAATIFGACMGLAQGVHAQFSYASQNRDLSVSASGSGKLTDESSGQVSPYSWSESDGLHGQQDGNLSDYRLAAGFSDRNDSDASLTMSTSLAANGWDMKGASSSRSAVLEDAGSAAGASTMSWDLVFQLDEAANVIVFGDLRGQVDSVGVGKGAASFASGLSLKSATGEELFALSSGSGVAWVGDQKTLKLNAGTYHARSWITVGTEQFAASEAAKFNQHVANVAIRFGAAVLVPELGSVWMMGLGLFVMGAVVKRRDQTARKLS